MLARFRYLLPVLLTTASAFAETTVIRAQRMLDVQSGRIVSPATLVVVDSYISAVNPPSLPSGATIVDLGDVTMLPGFIDMHVHILLQEGARYRADIIAETPPSSQACSHSLCCRRAASQTSGLGQ